MVACTVIQTKIATGCSALGTSVNIRHILPLNMAVIQANNLQKTYQLGSRTVHALRDLSLTIDNPGFYAIMGASGSGKSTLLHLIAGLDAPDAGTVTVADAQLHTMTERERTHFRRNTIGVVFQQFNLLPTMTALQNVALPATLAGVPAKERTSRSMELLDRLGLSDRADHRPEALSGGEQQRVAVARALYFDPPVLYADEPTGNLDSQSSESVWSLLEDIAKQHEVTVVMVTHEPAAAAHTNTTFLIRDGQLSGTLDSGALDASHIAAEYQRLYS